MRRSGEEKGDEHSAGARELVRSDGRRVDVSQQKIVHGLVPLAGEFVPGCRVPLGEVGVSTDLERIEKACYPILIKPAIGETEGGS